ILLGAGLPTKLPDGVMESKVAIAPIVSSGKTVNGLCRYWDRRYHHAPDFIVLEGPRAGGHLGFSSDEARNPPSLIDLLHEVKEEVKATEDKYGRAIPVFAAGGLSNRSKIEEVIRAGADGVQVGTRFIATKECDASQAYKEVYVKSSSSNLVILDSPVGMPARAIDTPFVQLLSQKKRIPPKACVKCLVPCDPYTTRYCITNALIEAQKGNLEQGLFFSGDSLDDIKEILSVEDLMTELMPSWKRLTRPATR
ncbi:MAG: nitronate monooxygenase family protein, partial [Eubacteriales bacterium]